MCSRPKSWPHCASGSRARSGPGPSARDPGATGQARRATPEDAPPLQEMRAIVMRALNRSELLVTAALPYKILPPNFNRYTIDNSHYGSHVDNTLRPLPDGSYLRTDVSATLLLSGPEEYEGGELHIEDTFGEHRVKLDAGSLVVYPSGSIHEVLPVTGGERLACYMFMQSLVRDIESRRHLFEMDKALISLRSRYGDDDPDLIRMTGLYHNLVRRWAEC
ncbi:MAG: Fe2+-dependent dioxygenase [Halioglobus sp.]|nr:Fe2+-dependent dioxygenase [Halioglobus sp.]